WSDGQSLVSGSVEDAQLCGVLPHIGPVDVIARAAGLLLLLLGTEFTLLEQGEDQSLEPFVIQIHGSEDDRSGVPSVLEVDEHDCSLLCAMRCVARSVPTHVAMLNGYLQAVRAIILQYFLRRPRPRQDA